MQTGVNHSSAPRLSLHHEGSDSLLLCAALALPGAESADQVPDWIHLLPRGELRTVDDRGPFKVEPPDRLILNSMSAGDRLPIDENHATDLAAPKGLPAPARGWIVALENRDSGIWGRVEWTEEGRQLVASRAYRGISPVLDHRRSDNVVFALRRASLVNRPNLRGLATLHQETSDMDLLTRLLAALGLPASTSEDTLLAAVTTLHADHAAQLTTLQAVAKAAGLDEGADGARLTETVTMLMAAAEQDKDAVITTLQAELGATTTRLNTLETEGKRSRAEAFVDGAILARKVGVKPLRDHYVTRHMANPAEVEKELNSLPSLDPSHTALVPPRSADGKLTLQAEQKAVAQLLGLSEADMLKTLQAEQATAA
tara:strand:+ start:24649 stop:25761 length:1113 start_codon:yes stop_codon:yes gene_type:complete